MQKSCAHVNPELVRQDGGAVADPYPVVAKLVKIVASRSSIHGALHTEQNRLASIQAAVRLLRTRQCPQLQHEREIGSFMVCFGHITSKPLPLATALATANEQSFKVRSHTLRNHANGVDNNQLV